MTVSAVVAGSSAVDGAPEAAAGSAPIVAEVQAVLGAWSQAWAARDVDAYLAHYAEAFKPADGKPRDEWVALRRSRIGSARTIEVSLDGVEVRREGERVVAEFGQNYRSDSYRSRDRKRVVMAKTGDKWQIVEETTLH